MTDKDGQGFLNYAQAWSLAAYMMNSGNKGRGDFRTIFDLSKRVGADRQTTYQGDHMLAWEDKFPREKQASLEKSWNDWVSDCISREKRVPDEDYFLQQNGYKPDVVDKLERYSEKDDIEKLITSVKKEEKRRKKAIAVEK